MRYPTDSGCHTLSQTQRDRVLLAYHDTIDENTFFEEWKPVNDNHDTERNSQKDTNTKWDLGKYAVYYFFTGGAPAMLTSYLPVYYRQLGLDPHQIGVVQSLQPWVSIPAIPVWGYLADRFNATRSILVFTLFIYLVGNIALAFTPKTGEEDCKTVMSRICTFPSDLQPQQHDTSFSKKTYGGVQVKVRYNFL